jgi:STE24 endopeptidase
MAASEETGRGRQRVSNSCWFVYLLVFLAISWRVFAQPPQSATSGVAFEADHNPVAVPGPSEIAIRQYQTGDALWIVIQAWALAASSLLLFTGLSARIRTWAKKYVHAWPLAVGVYLTLFLVFTLVINLPLSYYVDYVRPHTYALSNQSLGRWFGNQLRSLLVSQTIQYPPLQVPGLFLGYPFIVVLFGILKKSPKRWWLYTGLALVPFMFFGALVKPIWLDPLFHHYGPMKNKALEGDVLELAHRAGIDGGSVFEVDMSRDTKTMNANVVGLLGTKRIVLWDTLVAGMDRRELLTIAAHEMGHYVLGHAVTTVLLQCGLLLIAFGLVHRTAGPMIKRFKKTLGFDRLDDIASLPLIFLLLNLSLLFLLPINLAFQRSHEHEADRFALELTRDNHAAATAFVKLYLGNLDVPRHGWLHTTWRDAHPSLGDRIDFDNEYWPWDTGQPLKYERFFKTDK